MQLSWVQEPCPRIKSWPHAWSLTCMCEYRSTITVYEIKILRKQKLCTDDWLSGKKNLLSFQWVTEFPAIVLQARGFLWFAVLKARWYFCSPEKCSWIKRIFESQGEVSSERGNLSRSVLSSTRQFMNPFAWEWKLRWREQRCRQLSFRYLFQNQMSKI